MFEKVKEVNIPASGTLNTTYPLAGEELHAPRYLVHEGGEVSGRERVTGAVQVTVVTLRTGVAQEALQFTVRHVFHYDEQRI